MAEESPTDVQTPLSAVTPLFQSTLKKKMDNRDLNKIIRNSKLSSYSSKEDKSRSPPN